MLIKKILNDLKDKNRTQIALVIMNQFISKNELKSSQINAR
jgi:hypothetical protein